MLRWQTVHRPARKPPASTLRRFAVGTQSGVGKQAMRRRAEIVERSETLKALLRCSG